MSTMQLFQELFEQQVTKTPQSTAALFNGQALGYADLNAQANRLGHYIKKQYRKVHNCEIAKDALIGICVERSLAMLVSIIAIFKASAAYVPLDPDYPQERLEFILRDTGTAILLVQKSILSKLPFLLDLRQITIICLDDCADLLAEPDSNLPCSNQVGDLSYVIYTSGSTGLPKGAMVQHQGMVNHLLAKIAVLQLTAADVIVQNASQCFDISVWQYLAALLVGGKIVIVSNNVAHDPELLWRKVFESKTTILEIVPSMLRMSLDNTNFSTRQLKPANLRWLILTGEALSPALCADWYRYYTTIPILNAYGPTECSDDVTHYVVPVGIDRNQANVPIGNTIANMEIHVLDQAMQPVPAGGIGELYISGIGVGRGYLNLAEKTKEAFIANPFASYEHDKILYRTKDLGRLLADGNYEFLGRIDDQVKIHGNRIELGEITAVLNQCKGIKESIVATKNYQQRNCLLAYYVAKRKLSVATLRKQLSEKLPAYMLPVAFIRLDKMPLTLNGKVDKNSLPEPQPEDLLDSNNYVAPESVTAKKLVQIWQEILRLSKIGIKDNFYALGGDSLSGIQIVSRARAAGLNLTTSQLFTQQTIEKLIPLIEQAEALPNMSLSSYDVASDTIAESLSYPLSPMQHGMLFHYIYAPESDQYYLQLSCDLDGELNAAAFKAAWCDLVERHAVLRTSFAWEELTVSQQIVAPAIQLPWGEQDLSNLSAIEYQTTITKFKIDDGKQNFDLHKPGLFRLTLFKTPFANYHFLWTFHHIIFDGWSTNLLLHELTQRYLAIVTKQHFLPPAVPAYKQYIAWLARQDRVNAENYWRDALAEVDSPTELTINTQVLDTHKPIVNLGKYTNKLSLHLTKQCSDIAKRTQVTVNTLLLAAWAIVLTKYSNQADVMFGTVVSGRPAELTQVDQMIGLFINTIPLRIKLDPAEMLATVLQKINLQLQAASEFSYLGVNAIQAQTHVPKDSSLFHSLVIFENYPLDNMDSNVSKLTLRNLVITEKTNYPLVLLVTPGKQLTLEISYDSDCFAACDIKKLAAHINNVIAAIVTTKLTNLAAIDMLSQSERKQLLVTWNKTATINLQTQTVVQLFEAQVKKTPTAIAVTALEGQLTYSELNARANQLAHYLQDTYKTKFGKSIQGDALIGICMERKIAMLVAILGVLKAGAAYVPLNPAEPTERLQLLLKDANLQLLLTEEQVTREQEFLPSEHCAIICLDLLQVKSACKQCSAQNIKAVAGLTNLAYVIYTSGSTGIPKGVMIEHQDLANRLQTVNAMFAITSKEIILCSSAYTFDISLFELLGGLLVGAKLVITPTEYLNNLAQFIAFAKANKVTIVQVVPTFLALLLQACRRKEIPTVRFCISIGEELPLASVVNYYDKFPDSKLYNFYGPTEATIYASFWLCKPNMSRVLIGKPLPQVSFYVVDPLQQLASVGEVGEIYIGGVGIARGYLQREELTAERFITNPFVKGTSRCYKTGDLGRWLPDGNLEFLGRVDAQVKIHGYRIELGEIETILSAHPKIKQSAVIVRNASGQKQLQAYYVLNDTAAHKNSVLDAELRKYLGEHLPSYMVPGILIELPTLPLTSSGKINRKELAKKIPVNVEVTTESLLPKNVLQQQLIAIWQTLLKQQKIGINNNFFSLGGDSIIAIQMVSRARDFDIGITVRQIFAYPTIAQLANVASVLSNNSASEQATACQLQDSVRALTPVDLSTVNLSQNEVDKIVANATQVYQLTADAGGEC